MASDKQVAANRANAQRSTGPRTEGGKAKARLNATRHGLGVPAQAIAALQDGIAALARALAGDQQGNPDVLEAATRVAVATIDVRRVRQVRSQILERIVRQPDPPPIPVAEPTPRWPRSTRFSKKEYGRIPDEKRLWELIGDNLRDIRDEAALMSRADTEKRRQEAAITAAKDCHRQRASDWQQLDTLERYERRGLSRRARAIAALDEALAVGQDEPE